VGGKAQLAAYRAVAGDLRLAYAQFEELETFARFGTRLDPDTRARLERGRRVRAVLRQTEGDHLGVFAQIAGLLAATEGLLDDIEAERAPEAERRAREAAAEALPEMREAVENGEALSDEMRARLLETMRGALAEAGDGDA
jgi:F-type H+-transporting ATPase subunit alpha